MRLADQIAQCRIPFIVENTFDRQTTRLTNAADFSSAVIACPTRYSLSDGLVGLCCALAFSKGSRTLACADLLRVPAERVWIEWCEAPWTGELERYGFQPGAKAPHQTGRRGALIQSCLQGRRGLIKTFWANGCHDPEILASSMEAYFDFDTDEGDDPTPPDGQCRAAFGVSHADDLDADILRRCFRFRFEKSWQDYYQRARLSSSQEHAIVRHALGTISFDIPLVVAFLLLLATRPGLPRRPIMLGRLNQTRVKSGKAPLLEHVEVTCPLLPEYRPSDGASPRDHARRGPRLHHVRGHLVRRGSQISWRVPHLRGNSRSGVVRTRTVTWSVESSPGQPRDG